MGRCLHEVGMRCLHEEVGMGRCSHEVGMRCLHVEVLT